MQVLHGRHILAVPGFRLLMAKTYSITDGARLLGISAATLSRRLPPERAHRGRAARLTLQELAAIAPTVDADPEVLHRKAGLLGTFGPDLPPQATWWAQVAAERGLADALEAHIARIPGDLLERPLPELAAFDLPEPWGDHADWTPLRTPEDLDALIPAVHE